MVVRACQKHEQSIKNRCKIDAGKRYAKMTKNDAKMEPKWMAKSPKKAKNAGKRHAKNDAKI